MKDRLFPDVFDFALEDVEPVSRHFDNYSVQAWDRLGLLGKGKHRTGGSRELVGFPRPSIQSMRQSRAGTALC